MGAAKRGWGSVLEVARGVVELAAERACDEDRRCADSDRREAQWPVRCAGAVPAIRWPVRLDRRQSRENQRGGHTHLLSASQPIAKDVIQTTVGGLWNTLTRATNTFRVVAAADSRAGAASPRNPARFCVSPPHHACPRRGAGDPLTSRGDGVLGVEPELFAFEGAEHKYVGRRAGLSGDLGNVVEVVVLADIHGGPERLHLEAANVGRRHVERAQEHLARERDAIGWKAGRGRGE